MVLWFGTKKNVNGHRRYLGFSTELKQYTNQPSGWMTSNRTKRKVSAISARCLEEN